MSTLAGMIDEHFCFTCEIELNIIEEDLAWQTHEKTLVCPRCHRMYELTYPITGTGYPKLEMIGYSGEWD
jgi:hypothetical protein